MWLVGMMGSGKTTVGRSVAADLDVPFYDTDDMVTARAGQTVAEIWERVGESGFRALERQAMSEVPAYGTIAAAGGGAVLDEWNRALLRRSEKVIWLSCPPDELARRIGPGRGRPLLGDGDVVATLQRILDQRLPLYEEVATHRVDTSGRGVEAVAEKVRAVWNG